MWSEETHGSLTPRNTPEILQADLAAPALELAAWGVDSPGRLRWIDPPPATAFDQARQILSEAGALDGAGAVTRHGRRMAGLPMHPRLDYSGETPVLAVRIQEMFGSTDTPRVGGGSQPVLLHLLSPASRPMQVTADLAGFWVRGYPEVKKALKGRCPKHSWPDDPLQARPTCRTKKRSTQKTGTRRTERGYDCGCQDVMGS